MMNILLCPVGSAGDVHPFVGLGEMLAQRGHRVQVIVSAYFESIVRRAGLEFIEFNTAEEFLQLSNDPDLWHPRKGFFYIARQAILPLMHRQYEMIESHYVAGETVVVSSFLGFGARIAHDRLGVPLISVHLQPAVFWSDAHPPRLAGMPSCAPRWLLRSLFHLGEKLVIDPFLCPETNILRRELGLPPVRRVLSKWIHSPQAVIGLFPEWYSPQQSDWPPHTHLTSFPLWDERNITPAPESLETFLAAGDSPIVFTPGSAMMFGQKFFSSAVAACRLLGRRGILLSRFPDQISRQLPDSVQHFDFVPFSQVFPRASAVVHHGGIGTTAHGLAAGVPQLIMPMAHDQPDNATRLVDLGVGDWLSPRRFTPARVAGKLARLLQSQDVIVRCREIGSRLQGVDGLLLACNRIEEVISATTNVSRG